jgi:hypothetical protein
LIIATPAEASGLCSLALRQAQGEGEGWIRSGSEARVHTILFLVLRRGFPDVAGVLALPYRGRSAKLHRATSVRARTSGFITQQRHR